MICKDCYGKGIKHHFDMVTGITTIGPCHCNKPKSHKQWLSDLIKKMAEKDGKTEDEIREYLGVTT